MKTLIRRGRLVSPGIEMEDGSLLLEDGRISAVFGAGEKPPDADLVVEAGGRLILPGFIDIHSHGADGRDTCDGHPESIRHIARWKLAEGVTTWLPTTLSLPAADLETAAASVRAYMAAPEYCKVPGLHLEGPFLNPEKAGAQNPAFLRACDLAEIRRLHEIAPLRIVSLAPELPGAPGVIRGAAALGITTSAAHTAATYQEILTAKAAGLRHLTHFGNAMSTLHHREIGVTGAGLLDDDLMIELICDGIHLSPEMLQLVFKRVPVERIMMITDSMAAAWMDDGASTLGGLDVVVSNGAARLRDGGALAGSTLRFNEGLRNVARITGRPLHRLVAATSWNQARSLGLEGLGKLEPGYAADLVILDGDFSVWKTIVDGRQRDPW